MKTAIASAAVLVHIGAGRCRELDDYQAARAGKATVLVEAHPDLALALRSRAAGMKNTRVLTCPVAAESGERTLHVYNLPDRNSLRPAAALKDLYPGLRLQKEMSVSARSASSLLEAIDPTGRHSVCLVLDTPGEELAILQSLVTSDRIAQCRHIIIKCSREALYQESASQHQLREFLEASGYDLLASEEDDDPEFVTLALARNHWKLESMRAATALDDLRETLGGQIEGLKAEQAALQEKLAAREKEAQRVIDGLNKECETLEGQIEALKAERTAFQEKLAARETEGLSELNDAKRDLGLALRLQALREADLKDLQERYASLRETRKQQDELLFKLQQSLSVAAQHLNGLPVDDQGESRVVRELMKALSSGKRE